MNTATKKILAFLDTVSGNGVSTSDITGSIPVSRSTVLRRLQALREIGIVKTSKARGGGALWSLVGPVETPGSLHPDLYAGICGYLEDQSIPTDLRIMIKHHT